MSGRLGKVGEVPHRIHVLILAVCMAVAAGCGDNDGGSSPTPAVANLAGVWGGTSTLTTATGGECIGDVYRSLIGFQGPGTFQITQAGSALRVISTDTDSGLACDYTGTAGATSFTLNLSVCDVDWVEATCPSNGAGRRMTRVSGSVTGTVSGTRITGTRSDTFNLTTLTGASVGAMIISSTFTATKQ